MIEDNTIACARCGTEIHIAHGNDGQTGSEWEGKTLCDDCMDDLAARGVPERETADNWQQYAKEGETAQACIERHRREQDSLLKLLAQAREPLTDQQIISLVPAGWTGMLAQVMEFARRIERARTDGVATDGGGGV